MEECRISRAQGYRFCLNEYPSRSGQLSRASAPRNSELLASFEADEHCKPGMYAQATGARKANMPCLSAQIGPQPGCHRVAIRHGR